MGPRGLLPPGPRRRALFTSTVPLERGAAERAADQAAAPPAAVFVFDPALYPPAGSLPVVLTDVQQSAAAGVLAFPGVAFKVPRGKRLVIDSAQLFADSPALDTRATWALLVDGIPIAGLHALTMIFRVATSQASTFDRLRALVAGGAGLSAIVTNVDGAPRLYGVQLVGWLHDA